MAQFTLTIDLGNEAMQTERDVAESLRAVAIRIETRDGLSDGPIRDLNGNTVGRWRFKEDE